MLSCFEIETISMQNDKTLNSPSVLISFNYSRSKNKNSSTRCTGLTRMTIVGQFPIKALWWMLSLHSRIFAKAKNKRCD